MRAALLAALLLAACDQSQPVPPVAAPSPFPDAASIANSPADLSAAGENWRLDVDPFNGASLLERGRRTFTSSEQARIEGDRAGAFFYMFAGLTVTLNRADCVWRGVAYPLTAGVAREGRPNLSGCAFEQWDTRLQAAVQIADACAPVSENARRITLFQIGQGNVMLVRLRGENGGVDCRVVNDQLTHTPRDAALRIGGEGDLDLIRAPAPTPTDACVAALPLSGRAGILGWLVPKGRCPNTPPDRP